MRKPLYYIGYVGIIKMKWATLPMGSFLLCSWPSAAVSSFSFSFSTCSFIFSTTSLSSFASCLSSALLSTDFGFSNSSVLKKVKSSEKFHRIAYQKTKSIRFKRIELPLYSLLICFWPSSSISSLVFSLPTSSFLNSITSISPICPSTTLSKDFCESVSDVFSFSIFAKNGYIT